MDEFTKALVEFTLADPDKCSRNWLITVIEWQRAAARAVEREECAKMLELAAAQRDESMVGIMHDPAFQVTCRANAAAIRARGQS